MTVCFGPDEALPRKAMKRARVASDRETISEMRIVDTFTKLIFGGEARFSDRELSIKQALNQVDTNVALENTV